MATTNLKTRTGNRVVVMFDGKQIGLVQSVRMNDDYGVEQVYGVGDIHPVESVPTAARHTLQVSSMVLFTGAMREAGITAIDGDEMLQGKVFDIVVYSNDDGAELRKYINCSYASGDIDVSANRVIVSNAQFMALNVSGTKL